MSSALLRQLPSVSQLLERLPELVMAEGHARVVEDIRLVLGEARIRIDSGDVVPTMEQLVFSLNKQSLDRAKLSSDTAVINATGVIIHTNLGRAILSKNAQHAVMKVSADYSSLEYDLDSGERGKRGDLTERLLCSVTEAESALVVNNGAAAAVLMLAALAYGKGVIVSRGQLVEIGGGFRIPEILAQSGARLVEVGTTNRTRVSDYTEALHDHADIGAILHVHSSNFKVVGFTESASIAELAGALGRSEIRSPVWILDDVGSGALLDTSKFGLAHEPMPVESIRAGASVVTFSGDKLLGGPQAGILVGKRSAIEQCRRHPLARALRADKYTLAALQATVLHYLRGEAETKIPVWRMISMTVEEIRARALVVSAALTKWICSQNATCEIIDGYSTVGGGSLPGDTLSTALIAIKCERPDSLARKLRLAETPVISRISDNRVLLDLRTVQDDHLLLETMQKIAE